MSLRSKILAAILLPTILSIVAISILSYVQVKKSLMNQVLSTLETETHLISRDVGSFIHQFSTDLIALTHIPPLKGVVRAMDNDGVDPQFDISVEIWKQRLAQNLISQASSKKFYLEIDYLDETGQELVRVNYRNGQVHTVPPENLHDESKSPYFLELKNSPDKKILISDLYLQRNNGVLTQPNLPLLRLGTPVFDQEGNFHGALVVKIKAQTFLSRLKATSGMIFFTNSTGDYLFHTDPSRTFPFEFNKENNLFKDYPEISSLHETGDQPFLSTDTGKIFSLAEVSFDAANQNRHWIVARMFSEKQALQGVNHLLNLLLASAFFIVILLVGIAFLVSKAISKPIVLLTNVAQKISEGDREVLAQIETQDELGQLAKSFNKMLVAQRHASVETKKLMKDLDMQKYALDQSAIVSISDPSGKITYVNEMFSRISQYTSQELIGQEHRVLNSGYHSQTFMKEIWEQIASGKAWKGEIRNRRKDGSFYWLSTTIVPFVDSEGNPLEYLGIQFDITEQKEIAAENKEQRKKLNESLKILEVADVQQTGHAELNKIMIGESDLMTISRQVIRYLAEFTQAQVGAMYLATETGEKLKLCGTYAFTQRKHLNTEIQLGEGLVGQAALEQEMIVLQEVPDDYVRISSALGEAPPKNILVLPFLYGGKLIGVLELGSFHPFGSNCLEFLKSSTENIAVGINAAAARMEMQKLLILRQEQAEELQAQQEELRAANEELTEQSDVLKQSEERLKLQTEELHASNGELEEKTHVLLKQKRDIEEKNKDLQVARQEIEKKAEELQASSKYKSEFLANMSHELRTPLNSLLILSQHLSHNTEGHLSEDEVESAHIIYNSGNDLLTLINDILDLSKIEAGQMNIEVQEVILQEILESLQVTFQHVAKQRNVSLKLQQDSTLPAKVYTDRLRIGQILKNLISNALKFTHEGTVTLSCHSVEPSLVLQEGRNPQDFLGFSVIDTGIGIPEEKLQHIFQAFQQAEGGTTRKYGGTGLGLSISRELSRLLGGEIHIQSEVGQGSTFTLYLPVGSAKNISVEAEESHVTSTRSEAAPRITPQTSGISTQKEISEVAPILPPQQSIPDDRESLQEGERLVLVIEDDPVFAKILKKQCHSQGFRCLNALSGEEGLSLAKEFAPHAIILDINLPGISGWTVLEHLKETPETRHIPVHMMSANDVDLEALKRGAIGFLSKPVSQHQLNQAFNKFEEMIGCKMKRLLLVDDIESSRAAIIKLIGNSDVEVTEVATGKEAVQHLKTKHYHCMILDLGLPDISGFEVLKQMKVDSSVELPPVIVHTAKNLSKEEEKRLQEYTDSIVIKGVKSPERLLDESSLFLHRMLQDLPESQRKMIHSLHDKDHIFKEKTVLLVDDDMRNLYSLSKILQSKGMTVIKAENGQKALDFLASEESIDLVLMDIMMPILDGYETMQKIRVQPQFAHLPMIALTAKAMKEDRQKCMESGASDYLPKPVEVDRLFSMMRVWLYQ